MEASAQSPEQLVAQKRDLRRRYRDERALINPSNPTDLASYSWSHILRADEIASPQTIASYLS